MFHLFSKTLQTKEIWTWKRSGKIATPHELASGLLCVLAYNEQVQRDGMSNSARG